MRSHQEVVLGHEFVGRLVDSGPGCRDSVPAGADVVALPMLRRDGTVHPMGLSTHAPGAYAERLVVEESMAFAVPNGLPPTLRCSPSRSRSPSTPYGGGPRPFEGVPEAFDFLVGTMETINRPRLPWWHFWRAAEAAGVKPKAPVVFECVGIPGVIDEIIGAAPIFSRVVVVGVCMGADRIRLAMAINKEIDLRLVLGCTPLEFRATLHRLADGEVEVSALVTGRVGLDDVDAAFSALADPERHAKVVIDPARVDAEL